MIEFPHAVIADVAVGGPLRSEDQAGFTELKPVDLFLVEIQEVSSVFLGVDGDVLFMDLVFYISLIDLFSNDMKVNLLLLGLYPARSRLLRSSVSCRDTLTRYSPPLLHSCPNINIKTIYNY